MLHASVCNRTRVEFPLDAKRQKCQSVEHVITDLLRGAGSHSGLVNSVRVSALSDMRHTYETCLQLLLSKVAVGIATVELYTNLTLIRNSRCTLALYKRVLTLFEQLSTIARKIYVVMIPLPILKGKCFSAYFHFRVNHLFPFSFVVKANVTGCYCYWLHLSFLLVCIWRVY